MEPIFYYKIPFKHCEYSLRWDSEHCEVVKDIAKINGAMISINGELILFPEGISRAYTNRAEEMLEESIAANFVGNAYLSIRSCYLIMKDLFFFTDYVIGATEYADTIPPRPELKAILSNLLADRRKIQESLINLHELLFDLTIAAAKESGTTKSPVAECLGS